MPANDPLLHIQGAPVFKHLAKVKAKTFSINEKLYHEPIGDISKFLFAYRDIIEDTI